MSESTPLELIAGLTDEELRERVSQLAKRETRSVAALVAHLSEFDARRLHRAHACASIFTYCVQVLHLSEGSAFRRIAAARAVRSFPILLDCLVDGSLHLEAVVLLSPHLTAENNLRLIDTARGRSKREVEKLVATIRPLPSVADMIRKLPVARLVAVEPVPIGAPPVNEWPNRIPEPPFAPPVDPNAPGPHAPFTPAPFPLSPATEIARRVLVLPLGADRFRVQFTASAELHEKLRRAQAFLRHQIPDGDLARVFDRALTLLLDHVERRKIARRSGRPEGDGEPRPLLTTEPARPAPVGGELVGGELVGDQLASMNGAAHDASHSRSRHVPAAVRRDQGQCAFRDAVGRQCEERGFLEFHHVEPFARGGESTEENIQMRCRSHNQYESELVFGPDRWPDGARV